MKGVLLRDTGFGRQWSQSPDLYVVSVLPRLGDHASDYIRRREHCRWIPVFPIIIVPSQLLPEGRSDRFVGSLCLRINDPAISWSNVVGGCVHW